MSDRRRKIEALRAKAESTTFPAEAAALRAKADELAAQGPQMRGQEVRIEERDEIADWMKRNAPIFTPAAANVTVHFQGNGFLFEQMGGIRITGDVYTRPWERPVADDNSRVRVTDVNGRTYWVTVE